ADADEDLARAVKRTAKQAGALAERGAHWGRALADERVRPSSTRQARKRACPVPRCAIASRPNPCFLVPAATRRTNSSVGGRYRAHADGAETSKLYLPSPQVVPPGLYLITTCNTGRFAELNQPPDAAYARFIPCGCYTAKYP